MKSLIMPALLFSGWMALLTTDLPVKGNFLPALGRFISPFQGIWQSVVPAEGTYTLKGDVKQKVRILFDDRDVPHIYADRLEDALYAQGYLHAAHRLFAMDLSTRSAAGRLSELIGVRTLELDRKQRERGFEWSAQQKAKRWESDQANQGIFQAYIDGVNAYIHSLAYKDWPVEYKVLSHAPVEWTSTHCALTLTNMAIALSLGEDDLEYSVAHANLSPEDYAYLFPEHNPKESPVIPAEKKWDFTPLHVGESSPIGSAPPSRKDSRDNLNGDLNGSNNWAVAASKTKNGFPILANDPHLNLTLPNIWYEMEIHTPDMHVHGVSLPGLPFIVIGFNDHIAWGSTNSGQDVLDWYRITWQDSTRLQYKLDGKYVDATLRPEEIKIRGARAEIDTIRYTYWGPVTHTDEHKDMAMKWIGHQQTEVNDVEYLEKINTAQNVRDYREAVASFQYPAQNKIFASTEGDIAISVAGVMPLRPDGLGETLTDGDSTILDWQGYIPFAHAPYIINPQRGFVSSANQAPAATDYPYPLLGKRTFEDYRGRIVNMVLDTSKAMTVEDMKALQQNNYNLFAAELLPALLSALDTAACLTGDAKHIVDLLHGWNYQNQKDSLSPVFFDLWVKELDNMIWDELDNQDIMRPEDWRMVEIVTTDPNSKYFDRLITRDQKETLKEIACASFDAMYKAYRNLPDEQAMNWGAYKSSAIPHLARFPHFGADFISTSGGRHIVNAMNKSHGPSWRMVVELTSPPKAWVNIPGGESGNPASPHFRDMLDHYFEGTYYEVVLQNHPDSWTATRQITIQP